MIEATRKQYIEAAALCFYSSMERHQLESGTVFITRRDPHTKQVVTVAMYRDGTRHAYFIER